jgi:carbon-monoxide dehydrogenase medium subunit
MHVEGAQGYREIAAQDFFLGPLESSLTHGELLTGVSFPLMGAGWGSACCEIARRHGDYALAGVCALIHVSNSQVDAARLALFSVGGTPIVIDITDIHSDSEALDAKVQSLIDPESDIHATSDYRRQLVKTLVLRAIEEARANAESRAV